MSRQRRSDIDTAACYQMRVRGVLDPEWSGWLEGFTITPGQEETVLTGIIVDQAALHGLLNKIRDMGLPLLSLQRLTEADVAAGGGSTAEAAPRRGRRQPGR